MVCESQIFVSECILGKCFFIRELVENHVVRVPHVRTEDNLADLFTKPLEPRRFARLRDEIMGVGAAGAA